jgi:alkaline phosphatase D
MDAWDGYPAARSRLLDTISNGVAKPVVLSGDWHCAAAMTIHADPNNVRSKPIGHEFAGTSISSDCGWMHEMDQLRDVNPHVRHLNTRQRGYCRFDVSNLHWTTTYRIVDDPYNPNSVCRTDKELRTHEM